MSGTMGPRCSNLVPREKVAEVVFVDNQVIVVSHVGFNIRSTKTTLDRYEHRKLVWQQREAWALKRDKHSHMPTVGTSSPDDK